MQNKGGLQKKVDKAINNDLTQKLEYLGLDLENIPGFLYDFKPLNFNLSRLNNDKDHKIFRFVPISKIDILITPCLRSDSVREKYSKAFPLGSYLANEDTQEGLERYTTFLKMLNEFSISEVESVSNIQKEMSKKEPYRVRFNKEHLWHVYYSEATDRYFMMVCTKESTFAEFFYLLKKKIEIGNDPKKADQDVFIPINYVNYSEKYLNRDELVDIENYLWLFTKNWPIIYEVYNKKNEMSIQIIGETYVYENVKSTYKIKLSSEEEAVKFYKTLKALFVMQSEIKDYFSFSTKINSKNGLEIYHGNVKMDYDNLAEFIKSQYSIAKVEIEEQNKACKKLSKELEEIRNKTSEQELLYLQTQKEIGAYLECKKTFSGRMRYFFKSNKIKKKIQKEMEKDSEISQIIENEKLNHTVDLEPMETYMQDRDFYTIEDLVVIYSMLDKGKKEYQNLNQDIKAMKLKFENFKRKLKNAKDYMAEIDKHKKSFFGFWKFTKKDEILSLEEGEEENTNQEQIRRFFDFEIDFESLGVKMDKLQRKKLSKEEINSIFVINSNLNSVINSLKKGKMEESKIKSSFKNLKEEFNKNRLYVDEENFDIFANILDDSRKAKYIGSRSHRENEKNKYKIMNINRNIDEFDFTEKLQSIINYANGAMPKVQSNFDMPLYKLVQITEKVDENAFFVMNIDIENEFKIYEDKGEGALNLIKVNLKEGMSLLYYTNIIFYDNTNQTLPEGMDLSTQVLIDTARFDFKLVSQTKFRTNNYFRESDNLILPKSKDIFVYEYDVELKNKNNKKEGE